MVPSDQLASRKRRLFAGVIDILLIPVGAFIFLLVSGVLEHADAWALDPETGYGVGIVIWLSVSVIAGFYILNGLPLILRSQTLGKLLVGARVVHNESGGKVNLIHMILVRPVFFLLIPASALFGPVAIISLIDHMMIFAKGRRCLHDRISGTRVVGTKKS